MASLSDYDIIRRLDSGSFGTVFLAERKTDKKRLCLKSIELHGSLDYQRKIQEVENLSKLNSPHVVKYYASFMDSGKLYISMEYVECGSLQDLINV